MKKRNFKNNVIGLVGIWAFWSFAGIATAEEVHVSVGLKTWYTQWTETVRVSGSALPELQSDYTLMAGPNLGVTYGPFFAGMTYTTGNFSFSEKVVQDCGCTESVVVDSDRDDVDLVVGYKLHPRVSPLLGYKHTDITSDITVDSVNIGTVETQFSGPVIGVSANYPMGQSSWTLLGNVNYLWLEYEDKTNGVTSDAPGFSYELSGLYRVSTVPVHLTLGYKYQEFETDNGNVTDEFSGFTFGANYTF